MQGFPSIFSEIDDISKSQVEQLLESAFSFKKEVSPQFIYQHNRPIIATSFLENSTRTKHSFEVATTRLGCTYMDFNAEKSSLKKGETLEETFITLHAQGVAACILRSSESGVLSPFKHSPPLKVINGGDGTNQHPTQALLDLMTMIDIEGGIEGKTIGIIGDLKHSRVTHSLVDLLPQFGAHVVLCGPENFLYRPDKSGVDVTQNFDRTMKESDLIYLLRIQLERHGIEGGLNSQSDLAQYSNQFGVSLRTFERLGRTVPIYHPGPVNIGVELGFDVMRSPHYRGYEQVRNSTFMRMAILKAVLENGDKRVGEISRNVKK